MSDQKVYIDQPLTLELEVSDSLTGDAVIATACTIAYRAEDGTEGTWPATYANSKAICNIPAGALHPAGSWKLQALIQTATGQTIPATTYTQKVWDRFK